MTTGDSLPNGPLVTWYGDDFTGSSAVMEALTFSGLPSVLFFDIPTSEQLARFPNCRGVGIASTARTRSPEWMAEHLPSVFKELAKLSDGIVHYKVCTTLDSSPEIGSIGKALEIGAAALGSDCVPILIAAPQMQRYQYFGNLFAAMGDDTYRIDRHPVMSQHPVTPIHEADVARHLALQSDRVTFNNLDLNRLLDSQIDLAHFSSGSNNTISGVTIDCIDQASEAAAGALIWSGRHKNRFVVGSQGVEYALIEYFQSQQLLDAASPATAIGPAERTVVVSGSVSPVTARQIEWSRNNGFDCIRFETPSVCGDRNTLDSEIDRVFSAALKAIDSGKDPLIYSAEGPDDASVKIFREALRLSAVSSHDANQKIGESLGEILHKILATIGSCRAIISGGDTSGYATRKLDLYALTALSPTIPGAAIFRAHAENNFDGLELALKGGQMGSTDYFGWIRDGGGIR